MLILALVLAKASLKGYAKYYESISKLIYTMLSSVTNNSSLYNPALSVTAITMNRTAMQ